MDGRGRAGEGGAGQEEVGAWRGEAPALDGGTFRGESGGRELCKGPGGRGTLKTGSDGNRETFDLDFCEDKFS